MLTYHQAGLTLFTLTEDGKVVFGADLADDYYLEYLYDIGPDEVDQYDFYLTGDQNTRMEIGLQLPLPLSDNLAGSSLRITRQEVPDLPVSAAEITSLGVVLLGNREELSHVSSLELEAGEKVLPYRLANASQELYYETYDFEPGSLKEELFAHFVTDDLPADPETISAIRINGTVIRIP